MSRYTIRDFKYGDTECPMSKLQDLENKIEDGVLVKASDVAREIFAEIDEICRKYFNQCSKEPDCELMKMLQQGERFVINEMWHELADLKKKYESEGGE